MSKTVFKVVVIEQVSERVWYEVPDVASEAEAIAAYQEGAGIEVQRKHLSTHGFTVEMVYQEEQMPDEWVDPELFLEYEGVAVYRCYDDDNVVSGYWYTTNASDCNIDSPLPQTAQFDVRELPHLGLDAGDPKNHPLIIQHAIWAKLITGGTSD